MLWFGRYDVGEQWSSSSGRAIREVLERLLPEALPFSPSLLVSLALADRSAAEGRWAAVKLAAIERGSIAAPIDWFGEPPPGDALAAGDAREPLPFLQVAVHSRSGRPFAGILLVPDALYSLDEVQRALEASFEGGESRPGRYGVLASAKRPAPTLRPYQHSDLILGLSVYRCENPSCSSRGGPMLVSPNSRELARPGVDAVAYACPSCPGLWQERWALTWVRPFKHEDLRTMKVVEYRIRPTHKRRIIAACPMQVAINEGHTVSWAGWTSTTLPEITAALKRFLRTGRPADLRAALVDHPVLVGSLLGGLLSSNNLRAFVDYIRRLPIPQRSGGVATGLAYAFFPRRTRSYATAFDQIPATHYPYIAYEPEKFPHLLNAYGWLEHRGRFIDVGCGLGEKVFLAYALGAFSQCDGLEYDARTSAVAEFLFERIAARDRYPVRIMRGDALEFDRYGDYDVVYMYRPLRDPELMKRLLRRIAAQLKPGAVMIDVYYDAFALQKQADGTFVSVSSVPAAGRVVWDTPMTVDTFLERVT